MHEELIEILGLESVYYDPPASLKMSYPCIKYALSGIRSKRADDMNYNNLNRYKITIIDTDPDGDIHNRVLEHFKTCSFDTSYIADNLYHRILTLYY